MTKILICDDVADEAIKKMEDAGFEVVKKIGLDEAALIETVPGFDAMVVRSKTKVTANVIKAMDTMKVIARGGVGLDNIDQNYIKENNLDIKVVNTPAASSDSVAELVIGHMFGLARFIPWGNEQIKKGEWPKKKMKGVELGGKTLGIIGIGRIGQEVAKRATALGMTCLAWDLYITKSPIPDIVTMQSKDELLAKSDFITLHIPFIAKEGATLKADDFSKMKDGVFIVNAARGGTIDEKALLDALNSGKVCRVALDVFEKEPLQDDNIRNHPNIYLSPHIGASTVEGQFRVGMEVAEKLIDELK
ncbi:3-phosphoglycerate dehydrogenase [bacterium]|nr:3-phosphoglycerate dehydrogenase [bacterium]MBU1024623.1 3-phosphoglycerate dehydrogenase [bacterium]